MAQSDVDLRILADTIKDPRDLAELVHLSIATNRAVYITGKSIRHDHPKVSGIISSWFPDFKFSSPSIDINYTNDFFACVKSLKDAGYSVIGTSPNFGKSIFETDLSKGKHVVVFGTEVGGLSKAKIAALDSVVRVPMLNQTKFYTLHTVIPIIVHEVLRQKGFFDKGVMHGSKNKTN